ncbi:MAG TPA: hypothetical protein VKT81_25525 [Bryobacteraceae bacterium]|nr:hypothetical protein [Bryobacteraceae bacterium]
MQATDFWGEIGSTEVRTPLSILREQAAALGPKTLNLVEAKVETRRSYGQSIVHSFQLVVPALDDYTYQLFEIEHGADLYPLTVKDEERTFGNEKQFTDWLQKELSSEKTKKLVSNLLAQVRS